MVIRLMKVTNGLKNRENNQRTIFQIIATFRLALRSFFVCLLENVLQKIGAIEMENL